jgi:histidine ammonia-lyase
MHVINIHGELSTSDLQLILQQPVKLYLSAQSTQLVLASSKMVDQTLASGKLVYGINTGVGLLANQQISTPYLAQLQRNIILSHACGTGELLTDDVVRLMMALKINSLARGFSGVRPALIQALIALFNAQVYPCIPKKGSVGASGDLAPLAHLSLPLLGVGELRYQGKTINAEAGLKYAGLSPNFELAPKEGLALLNGMQASTAIALKALLLTETLFYTAMIAGSLTLDAATGSDTPFDERIHAVRGHLAQQECARIYRELLQGSAIRESHRHCSRVQDPYSLRCQPQIMGACLHQMNHARDVLMIEANAVSDNPLVFAAQGDILSGGNFHGEIVAMAADNLSLAIAEIGALAERRIALLMDKHISGLPAFLVECKGLNSGFMLAHVTAAALASDNKALAHPHCIDSLPTSANQEDHVSMATNAVNRLAVMIDNTAGIMAIELLAACQGLEFRFPLKTSPKLQQVYALIRSKVDAYHKDRYFAPDIAVVKDMVLAGKFTKMVEGQAGQINFHN